MGRDPKRRWAVVSRILTWVVVTLSIGCALVVVLFLGLIDYLGRDTCDNFGPSPVVRNSRDDSAEGWVQVCSLFGTFLNFYVTIQIHQPTRTWPKTDLVDYDPAGPDHPPKLRWLDDKTLSVDLGTVDWVSLHINRLGNIRIIYIYSMADPPR